MSAPAEFVVLRHLLSHPEDSPAEIARHCNLHDPTVRAAIKRLQAQDVLGHEPVMIERMRNHQRRIAHRRFTFKAPNPDQFLEALSCPAWISGEHAAAAEGYDLVPERMTLYVRPEHVDFLAAAAKATYSKVAPESKSNVIVKIADQWLHLEDEDFVERGQRILDYLDSRHIQILRELDA